MSEPCPKNPDLDGSIKIPLSQLTAQSDLVSASIVIATLQTFLDTVCPKNPHCFSLHFDILGINHDQGPPMPKKPTFFEIEYMEQDLEKIFPELVAECCADALLDCYISGNHAEMAKIVASTPNVSLTLCQLIEYAIEHRLIDITTRAAAEKHQRSGYGELKERVLAFFHADAHRCDDRTCKPIYRSKSAFLDVALTSLVKEVANAQQEVAKAQQELSNAPQEVAKQLAIQAAVLKKLADRLKSLTPRTMAGWLEELRPQFPSHWPVRDG